MSCEINFFNDITGESTGNCPEWTTCLTNMFRAFIGDIDPANYEYSDARVCQLLNTAAFFVSADLCDCPGLSLEVDLINSTIDPDPLTDPILANLIVFRAICMVDIGEVRLKSAIEGVKAVCGPASMGVSSTASTWNYLFSHGACGTYTKLKEQCCFRKLVQTAAFCKAILAPFSSGCYQPGGCDLC